MKLNKTCCSLVNFGSCFIVHSLGMGLFLFIDGPALVFMTTFHDGILVMNSCDIPCCSAKDEDWD